MDDEFSLREEIYQVAHKWPYPVLAVIVGSLIGVVLSFIFPPSYKAEIEVFLSYNDLQACRNPDDCKNWLLAQMDALAKSETVLEPTLANLQSMDDYWNAISLEDLSGMLDVAWRNTGVWSFTAETDDPQRSAAAVETWVEIFLEEYRNAVEHVHEIIDLNARLFAIHQNQVELQRKLMVLNMVQNSMVESRDSMDFLDAGKPLSMIERWKLYHLAAQAAAIDQAWMEILESIPAEEDPLSSYQPWLDRLMISINQNIQSINAQLEQLDAEAATTLDQIELETERSHGLSQLVEVRRMLDEPANIEAVRHSTAAAVMGGIIGLLLWVLIWIAKPIWRSRG